MIKLKSYTIIAIVFLAFVPLIYQVISTRLTTDELFSKNFVIPKFIVTREGYRSNAATPDNAAVAKQKALYYEAIEAYSKEAYTSTVLLFNHYLELAPDNHKEVALYLGVAYLMTDQFAAAQDELQFLLENGSAKKKQDAEWYLVLTLLKQEQVEQAKDIIHQILNKKSTSPYQEKAKDLLEEIHQLQP
ncbi:MAG: tol-pal system YbgF family protein [Aureispira sp.]